MLTHTYHFMQDGRTALFYTAAREGLDEDVVDQLLAKADLQLKDKVPI